MVLHIINITIYYYYYYYMYMVLRKFKDITVLLITPEIMVTEP